MAPHDELKQLKIKSGVLKRIVKDLAYTRKEIASQAAKVEKMRAESADAYDIKKQEEVLAEYASTQPQDEERLGFAIQELSKLVDQCRESPDFSDLEVRSRPRVLCALLLSASYLTVACFVAGYQRVYRRGEAPGGDEGVSPWPCDARLGWAAATPV